MKNGIIETTVLESARESVRSHEESPKKEWWDEL
jgi:hypothetical protein